MERTNERDDLRQFVGNLHDDMRLAFVTKVDVFFRTPERGLASQAFLELETKRQFETLIEKASSLGDNTIVNYGLYGHQLAFKLYLFNENRRKFYEALRFFNHFGSLYGRGRRLVVKQLKKLFVSAEPILESLVSATGFGHAITELKDSAENSMS